MARKHYSFLWDAANTTKLWSRHAVRPFEVEEAWNDPEALLAPDVKHSATEDRYILLGKSRKHRLLFIVFTVRAGRIRPLSARTASREEVALYEEETHRTKV
jgi:uncharacterized protein